MTGDKILLRTLMGEKTTKTPFWFMRQAGRYLPEYREVRKQAGSFLDLCYNPELATEVTLQPIRRFGMSGAILFSDILILPHALGVDVRFAEGEGPIVEQILTKKRIDALTDKHLLSHTAPVLETIKRVKKLLPTTTTLLGFTGAPWTVACYMIEGKGSKDFASVRRFAYENPKLFDQIIDLLTETTITYLSAQIEAGVDAIQLFDSWAGVLSPAQFERFVIAPNNKIIKVLKNKYPKTAMLCFPRGAAAMLTKFSEQVSCDGISIDTTMPMDYAKKVIKGKCLQGNIDPLLLASDLPNALAEAKNILDKMRDERFIFNLGHGMVPHTPIENVVGLCDLIREYR